MDTANNGLGTWNLVGGTLVGGTIVGGTLATANGAVLQIFPSTGTLNGLTVAVNSEIVLTSAVIAVTNGLTVHGKVSLNGDGNGIRGLLFSGSQTQDGTGEVKLSRDNLWLNQNGITLTIGPNLWIHGIGCISTVNGYSGASIVNNGTITADAAGTLNVGGYGTSGSTVYFGGGTVTNTATGTLQLTGGSSTTLNLLPTAFTNLNPAAIAVSAGTLGIATGSWTNPGPINLSGGTFNLSATAWQNSVPIAITGGTLNLGGSVTTANLGNVTRLNGTAGTVNLTGTLNNTGATFLLDPTASNGLGNVTMTNAGTITGGTLVTGSGAALTTLGGTINSLTVAAGSTLNHNNSFLYVGGTGLTVDGTVNVAASTYLRFITDVTVGGSGVINVAASGALGVTVANKTLIIDSGLTVRYTGASGKLGSNYPGAATMTSGVTIVNRGRIQADTGGAVTVSGTTVLSSGTLEAITSISSLIVTGTGSTSSMTLSGTVRAVGGSTVQIGNAYTQPWSNTGAIIVDHATLDLRGTFHTADVNAIQNTAGTINMDVARLENARSELVLDGTPGATGTWTMSSSEIRGGTITTRNGAVPLSQSGDLYGVTISEGSVVQVGHNNNLGVYNGMTLNGRIEVLSYYGAVYFTGKQTLGGTGTVEFMWRTGAYSVGLAIGLFLNQANMTLTIDEGVTVRGGLYNLGTSGGATGTHLINRGTIIRDTDHSGQLTTGSCVFTNYGTVRGVRRHAARLPVPVDKPHGHRHRGRPLRDAGRRYLAAGAGGHLPVLHGGVEPALPRRVSHHTLCPPHPRRWRLEFPRGFRGWVQHHQRAPAEHDHRRWTSDRDQRPRVHSLEQPHQHRHRGHRSRQHARPDQRRVHHD